MPYRAGAAGGSRTRQRPTSGRSSRLQTGGISCRCMAARATSGVRLIELRPQVVKPSVWWFSLTTCTRCADHALWLVWGWCKPASDQVYGCCVALCRERAIACRAGRGLCREVRAWLVVDEVPALATPAAAAPPAVVGFLPDEVVLGDGASSGSLVCGGGRSG